MKVEDVTRCSFFAPDPKLMTVNFDLLAQKAKEMREERDAQPVRSEGPQEELQRLRHELFKLEQHAKHSEVYTNEQAGQVKLLESNLTHALTQKKTAVANGNVLSERFCEHTIMRLEHELDEAVKEFTRARKVSAGAAIVLKDWPHHARLKELQTSLGA